MSLNFEDIKPYLPKYLSAENQDELFRELGKFPKNLVEDKIYTNNIEEELTLFQGDGIKNLIIVNLPDTNTKHVPGLIISNTCDVDPTNKRFISPNILFSPIVALENYIKQIRQYPFSEEQIKSHLDSVRTQKITSLFYLPKFQDKVPESVAFLDRIYNIPNDYIRRDNLKDTRIFSLSNYGFYLFLFKISIHFTRIQEKVDRN